jgi:hypothetical protein
MLCPRGYGVLRSAPQNPEILGESPGSGRAGGHRELLDVRLRSWSTGPGENTELVHNVGSTAPS